MRLWIQIAASIALLFGVGLHTRINAQAVGATLSGTITDQSGGVVPNANVAILNTATGDTRTVTTNVDGIYSAPNLQPGTYSVTATAAGFQKMVQNGLTLTVGATQTLNLTMPVGQSNQTVEVTAEAPTVNLSNAEIGAITTERTIEELPLNGRSWSDLANLQAGVYQLHTQPDVNSRDRFTRGYGLQLSISGNRPQQNNYRVDGISINDPGNGGPGNVLGANAGVDAISEFSVLTTNYSTEYGRASGGIINATTKSGTNQFHGSVYEFLRNSYLDTPNYWDAQDANGNRIKPQFRRNQFGASAGGPIIKDKTFVFGDYEGLRQAKGLTYSSKIPSATARLTVTDPGVLAYLPFFPTTGTTVCTIVVTGGDTDRCNFGAPQTSTENYYIIRADHNISEKDRLSGTFFRDKSNTNTIDEFKNKSIDTATSSTFATIAETHSFSSNFVNSARFGFHRDFQGGPAGAHAINPLVSDSTLGAIPGFDAAQVFFGGTPIFTGGLTSPNPQVNHWNTFQVYNDAFWTKGKHSFRFGGNVERDQLNVNRSPRPGGLFQFKTMAGFLTNAGGTAGFQKLTADLPGTLTPREARQTIFGVYFQDDWRIRPNLTINMGLRYEPTTVPSDAQGKNSTLATIYDPTGTNLPLCGQVLPGVCNPFPTGGLYKNNSLHDFDPRVGFAWDPQSNGKMSVRGGIGMYDQLPLLAFMGSTSNGQTYPFLQSGSSSNLAAGSFGPFAIVNGGNPCGTTNTAAFCQIGGKQRQAFIEQAPKRAYVIQWNLSVQREILPSLTAMVGYVGSHGVHGTTQVDDTNIVMPTKIAGQYYWPCDGATPFTGGNQADCPGLGSGTNLNQSVGRLPTTFFRNSSVYHGLEVQLTKAMSHGLQVQGSFTYQKSIDTASGAVISDSVITAISSLDWFDPKLTRAVSDFNASKVFSVNYLWNIPTPKSWTGIAQGALGGWQLGGIFSASTGSPFTPILAADPGLNSTDAFGYPDRVSGPGCSNPVNTGNRDPLKSDIPYIKLQCFKIPAVVNIGGVNYIPRGNVGRNILTGPGLENLDFSLVKNTRVPRISETFNIQFRWEVFNITNRANFNPPVSNFAIMDPGAVTPGLVATPGPVGACPAAGDPNSGCLASAGALDGGDHTATDSRQMQLSLKFTW
jgi:hypothetical protein